MPEVKREAINNHTYFSVIEILKAVLGMGFDVGSQSGLRFHIAASLWHADMDPISSNKQNKNGVW
eukprot:11193965-Ditylum_brightwellii.AAC.1